MPSGLSRSEGISVPLKRVSAFGHAALALLQKRASQAAPAIQLSFSRASVLVPQLARGTVVEGCFLTACLEMIAHVTCSSSKAMQLCSLINNANP